MCQPEATFGAYKAAYDLTTDCEVGATEIGGSAEALTLAKCVAASRQSVYTANNVSSAESDLGGLECGVPVPEKASGSTTTTIAVSSVLALVAVNL